MFLKLNEDSAEDKNLKKAINITNHFLKTDSVNQVFKNNFQIDFSQTQNKINNLRIIYSIQVKEKKEIDNFAWTIRSLEANIIHINDNFRKKLVQLQSKDSNDDDDESKQTQIIIVYISILILHELAHLVLRWKGIMDSPQDFGESGNYLENKVFGGVILILICNNYLDWNENSKYFGIGFSRVYRRGCDQICILSYEDYIKKIYFMSLVGESYVQPVVLSEKIPKNVIALQESDEQIEEKSEEWIKSIDQETGPFIVADFMPNVIKCPFMIKD